MKPLSAAEHEMKIGDLGLDDGGKPQLSPSAGCAMVCGLASSMSITIALHHARFRDQLLRLISCWERPFLDTLGRAILACASRSKARSSGGERYLDTVEVDGSRPSAPTTLAEGIRLPLAGGVPLLFLAYGRLSVRHES
jgi:hypothetical protein